MLWSRTKSEFRRLLAFNWQRRDVLFFVGAMLGSGGMIVLHNLALPQFLSLTELAQIDALPRLTTGWLVLSEQYSSWLYNSLVLTIEPFISPSYLTAGIALVNSALLYTIFRIKVGRGLGLAVTALFTTWPLFAVFATGYQPYALHATVLLLLSLSILEFSLQRKVIGYVVLVLAALLAVLSGVAATIVALATSLSILLYLWLHHRPALKLNSTKWAAGLLTVVTGLTVAGFVYSPVQINAPHVLTAGIGQAVTDFARLLFIGSEQNPLLWASSWEVLPLAFVILLLVAEVRLWKQRDFWYTYNLALFIATALWCVFQNSSLEALHTFMIATIILIGTGLEHLHQTWKSRFPHNPSARTAKLSSLIVAVVSLSALQAYQTLEYRPQLPELRSAYGIQDTR